MEDKNEYLCLEAYINKFKEYTNRAALLPKSHKTIETFQNKLSQIGLEAGTCYSMNKNAYPKDYQHRVNIFLGFDEYLKQLKREFKLSLPVKTSSCKFYDNKKGDFSEKENSGFKDTLDF